ncbi:hypothetical protein C8Q80DRAFT_1115680 [Daedaleopsis nitida]|nr:hypothetical protein C8Q80DRAFT_1115678 [Daedaleopsis nitida]KAI0756023.1 hypothetical protein C8Q80DRAFT_1115680 [Daedaleopsis nitida]
MAIGKWIPFGTTQSATTPVPVVVEQPPTVSAADAKLFGLENFGNTCQMSFPLFYHDTVATSRTGSAPTVRLGYLPVLLEHTGGTIDAYTFKVGLVAGGGGRAG